VGYRVIEARDLSTRHLLGTWVPFGEPGEAYPDDRDLAGIHSIEAATGLGATQCSAQGVEVEAYPGEPGAARAGEQTRTGCVLSL